MAAEPAETASSGGRGSARRQGSSPQGPSDTARWCGCARDGRITPPGLQRRPSTISLDYLSVRPLSEPHGMGRLTTNRWIMKVEARTPSVARSVYACEQSWGMPDGRRIGVTPSRWHSHLRQSDPGRYRHSPRAVCITSDTRRSFSTGHTRLRPNRPVRSAPSASHSG